MRAGLALITRASGERSARLCDQLGRAIDVARVFLPSNPDATGATAGLTAAAEKSPQSEPAIIDWHPEEYGSRGQSRAQASGRSRSWPPLHPSPHAFT